MAVDRGNIITPTHCVVSGNVWPELITAGTVMRPMVSDMECGLKG